MQSISFKERLAVNFPATWAVFWRLFAVGLCLGAFPNALIVDNQSSSLVYVQLSGLALLLGLLGAGIYLALVWHWEFFRRQVRWLLLLLEFLLLSLFMLAVFLPAQYGNFDGTEFMRTFTPEQVRSDWLRFGTGIAVALGITLLAWRFRFRLGKFILLAVALLVVFTAGRHFRDELSQTGFDDFRLLGREKNIVVIILDALQGTFLDLGFQEDEGLRELYRDFTFYRRAVSPGSCTLWALPGVLHGEQIYDVPKTIPAMRDVVVEDSLFDDLAAKGIKYNYLTTCWTRYFHPSNQLVVSLPAGYYKVALQLAATRILPLGLARAYLRKTMNEAKRLHTKLLIRDFTQQLVEKTDFSADQTRFLFYHSLLTHSPVILDRAGNLLPDDTNYSPKLNRDENAYALTQLAGLLDNLKAKGVYDSSLIVIMGDHGGSMPLEYEHRNLFTEQKGIAAPCNLSVYNPAVLIKPPYQTGELQFSDAPFANSDLRPLVRFYLETGDWRQQPKGILEPAADRAQTVFAPVRKSASDSPDLPDLTKVTAPDIFAALKSVCDDPAQAAIYEPLPVDKSGLKLSDYWLGYMLYGRRQEQAMLLKSPSYLCFSLPEQPVEPLYLQLRLSPIILQDVQEGVRYQVLSGEREAGRFLAERKGLYQVRIPHELLQAGRNILTLRAENPVPSSKLGMRSLRYEEQVSGWLSDFQLSRRSSDDILGDQVPILPALVNRERVPDYCFGFWHQTRKGSWLTGEGGELRFALPELPRENLRLGLQVSALVSATVASQQVKVTIAGQPEQQISLTAEEKLLELTVPRSAFSSDKVVRIRFTPENPINPVQAQVPYWTYNGKLSFCVREIILLDQEPQ
jgi:hypothetical protein